MGNLQGWEIAILAVTGFIAVTSLVRLMRHRREELTQELLAEVAEEERIRAAAEAAKLAEEARIAKEKKKRAA